MEREFEWLKAAALYEEAFESSSKADHLQVARIEEMRGYALFRAARQAPKKTGFRELVQRAIESYERARGIYEKSIPPLGKALALRCQAMARQLLFWLADKVTERRALLEDCWIMANEALGLLETLEERREFGITYNKLVWTSLFAATLDPSVETRKKKVEQAIRNGEKAFVFLTGAGENREAASTAVSVSVHLMANSYYLAEFDHRAELEKKAVFYWKKACDFSEDVAVAEHATIGMIAMLNAAWKIGDPETVRLFKRAIEYAKTTRDRLIVGSLQSQLAFHLQWASYGTPEQDERVSLDKNSISLFRDAEGQFETLDHPILLPDPEPKYYTNLAEFETDRESRRTFLKRAVESARKRRASALRNGHPVTLFYALGALGRCLALLAKTEHDSSMEKILLEEALTHSLETFRICEEFAPYSQFELGFVMNSVASIRLDLAKFNDSTGGPRAILEAIREKETALALCEKGSMILSEHEAEGLLAVIGRFQNELGILLVDISGSSVDDDTGRRGIGMFEKAVESFRKANLPSRVAECYWKMGMVSDRFQNYQTAAEQFQLASESYNFASESYQQLKNFYQEYATYMYAWSEVENARHYQSRQEYDQAQRHYEKSSALHESTRHWNYLAPNYLAWAMVENAENLSREGSSEGARESFEKAMRMFMEFNASIASQAEQINDQAEKEMAHLLAHAAIVREEYCSARSALEEARTFDKKGNHTASADRFGKAAESFDQATQMLSGREREEVELLSKLSRAWRSMAKAEAEADPALYLEASQLFDQAKETAITEASKLLILGHSHFCRALDSLTKYSDTGSEELYDLTVQELETSAKYYLKAGSQKDAEYLRASRLLLDAYSYLRSADKSRDQQERAKLYIVTEKVLRVSTGSFAKAGYSDKADQVSRLLSRVSQDKELAISLTELFNAPLIVSDSRAIPTLTSSFERPVGLERFEHGDVQGEVKLDKAGLKVGGNLTLEVQLTNTGRTNVQLLNLENLVPEGFEMVEKPAMCRIEGSRIDMKGRRLSPMKTESFKLSLSPGRQGTYELAPTAHFVDERGEYRTLELNRSEIIVLGNETKHALPIMEFLAKRFVDDYMTKHLSIDSAGWCGLMDIAEALNIPKAQLYADSRQGHAFGRPLRSLVKEGLVEYRIFVGVRGRGGRVTKVRANYEKQPVKSFVDELALKPLASSKKTYPAEKSIA